MALKKYAGYAWNLISLVGMILAVTATCLIIGFLSWEVISGIDRPYHGLMTYFLFPGMLIVGLILVPLGAYRVREKRRRHPEEVIQPFPQVDFNDPHKRRLFIFFVVATIVFVLIVCIATIKGYEFTESTTFCGELCHKVMQPEHTAWSNSPHARVKCVDCHVGPGAAWYVKGKLSGVRQVFAVFLNTYSRPIQTPIENLRPARDTCEGCHWPEKFYLARQKIFYHFAPNEENTPRQVDMLINIGSMPRSARRGGIHWHIGNEVSYIATDRQRMNIPYIAVKEGDGSLTEFMDAEKPLSREDLAKAAKRVMDCLDCHNRPAHIYRAPAAEVDEGFVYRRLDPKLPYLKKVAVDLLGRTYRDHAEAKAVIAREFPAYYAKNYPAVARDKQKEIAQAVAELQGIYTRNIFPGMKVAWNTYPNHIGHFYSPGCFRCHDGKHKTASGRTIPKDCNICHSVLGQIQENIPPGTAVTQFVHPVDIGAELFTTNCSDCHSVGGEGLGRLGEGTEKHARR